MIGHGAGSWKLPSASSLGASSRNVNGGCILLRSCVLPEGVLACLSGLALPSGTAEVQEKIVSSPVATSHAAGGRENEAYIREQPRFVFILVILDKNLNSRV